MAKTKAEIDESNRRRLADICEDAKTFWPTHNYRATIIMRNPDNEADYMVVSEDSYEEIISLIRRQQVLARVEEQKAVWAERAASAPPVDRTQVTTTDGKALEPDWNKPRGTDNQQKQYKVLNEQERAKGFVRPVRDSYIHTGKCGETTVMGRALAETFARDPGFYHGTYCSTCNEHFPLDEFVWSVDKTKMGE